MVPPKSSGCIMFLLYKKQNVDTWVIGLFVRLDFGID